MTDIKDIKIGDHIYFLGKEFTIVKSIYEKYYLKDPIKDSFFWEEFKSKEINWKQKYYILIGRSPTANIPTFNTIEELVKFTRNYQSNTFMPMGTYDVVSFLNPYGTDEILNDSCALSLSACDELSCNCDDIFSETKNTPIIQVKHKKISLFN